MSKANDSLSSSLEEAYEMQLHELSLLEEEDLAGAYRVAQQREAKMKDSLAANPDVQNSTELVDKVKKLQELQSQVSGMARKLRDDLEEELIRVRSENTRFSGYKQASKVTPLTNRFSKRG